MRPSDSEHSETVSALLARALRMAPDRAKNALERFQNVSGPMSAEKHSERSEWLLPTLETFVLVSHRRNSECISCYSECFRYALLLAVSTMSSFPLREMALRDRFGRSLERFCWQCWRADLLPAVRRALRSYSVPFMPSETFQCISCYTGISAPVSECWQCWQQCERFRSCSGLQCAGSSAPDHSARYGFGPPKLWCA